MPMKRRIPFQIERRIRLNDIRWTKRLLIDRLSTDFRPPLMIDWQSEQVEIDRFWLIERTCDWENWLEVMKLPIHWKFISRSTNNQLNRVECVPYLVVDQPRVNLITDASISSSSILCHRRSLRRKPSNIFNWILFSSLSLADVHFYSHEPRWQLN